MQVDVPNRVVEGALDILGRIVRAIRHLRPESGLDRTDIRSKTVGTSTVTLVDEETYPRLITISVRNNYLFLTRTDRGTTANTNSNGFRLNSGSGNALRIVIPAGEKLFAASDVANNVADLIIQEWRSV